MDLKNITVEDLKEKFAAFDKKTLIKFGIGIGAIILFLIIYFAILRPMVNEKKATLDDQINKEMEIQKFENDIITIKKRIKKMEPIVEKNSFGNPTIVSSPVATIAPLGSFCTTFMSSLSKFSIFFDLDTALLNLI